MTLTKDDMGFLKFASQGPDVKELAVAAKAEGSRLLGCDASRTIRANSASDWALQVNTPIDHDVWECVATVRVEGNRASGFATQLNYATSMEAFIAVIKAREVTAAR